MSEFFVDLAQVSDAELFGLMIHLGLALTATKDEKPGDPERENAIRMYDEIVGELNSRGELRRKAAQN